MDKLVPWDMAGTQNADTHANPCYWAHHLSSLALSFPMCFFKKGKNTEKQIFL